MDLLPTFSFYQHLMMWPPLIHHDNNHHQPKLDPRPPFSLGSPLSPLLLTKCQATSFPSPHAHESFKKVNILFRSL